MKIISSITQKKEAFIRKKCEAFKCRKNVRTFFTRQSRFDLLLNLIVWERLESEDEEGVGKLLGEGKIGKIVRNLWQGVVKIIKKSY